MWILILTLIMEGGYGNSSSMESIEFKSKESCLTAGNVWIKKISKINYLADTSAICVKK